MQYSEGYILDGRYEFKRYVGSGTFGEVWVAVDKATDIEVAIKVYVSMDEKGLEDFKKEFQISFELNHTNLLHANYLGVNSDDKRPYLVMPFCPEGSVNKFMGQMSEEDLWRFIRDVASGLAYLHSQQPPIIHQDIKPDNILILKNGDFVITDFGISKQLRATMKKSARSLNSAGAISYMGPERFSKQYHAVKASDIWSLGASIFELATGELPFCGMGGSLQKQGADMPELPEEFSQTLDFVCQSCMAKQPWERPTAQQLAEFAGKMVNGDSPQPTWKAAGTADSTQEAGQTPAAENIQQGGKPSSRNVKGTVVAQGQNIAGADNASPVPANVFGSGYPEKEAGNKVSPAVWAIAAAAGLAIGFLLNYFI